MSRQKVVRKVSRNIYRAARALLFAAILTVVALYLLAYVLVAMPAVQQRAVNIASAELSAMLGSKVEIGSMEVFPFNELRLHDVVIYEPEKQGVTEPCVRVKKLGAGIELSELFRGNLVFSYAEIIDADVRISKMSEESAYNIAFLIDAFKSEEDKQPKNFSMKIRTVALRDLSMTYDLLWVNKDTEQFDPSHFKITDLRADLALPRLETVPLDLEVRLRRLAFKLNENFFVEDIAFVGELSQNSLTIKDVHIGLPESVIKLSDLSLQFSSIDKIKYELSSGYHQIDLFGNICPADFRIFMPSLAGISSIFNINLSGETDLSDIRNLAINVDCNDLNFYFEGNGSAYGLNDLKKTYGEFFIDKLEVSPESSLLIRKYIPDANPHVRRILDATGNPSLKLTGAVSRPSGERNFLFNLDGCLLSEAGNINMSCDGDWDGSGKAEINAEIYADGIKVGELSGTDRLGNASFEAETVVLIDGKQIEGSVALRIPLIETKMGTIDNLVVTVSKDANRIKVDAGSESNALCFQLSGDLEMAGASSVLNITSDVDRLPADLLGLSGVLKGSVLKGCVHGGVKGNDIDNICGSVIAEKIGFIDRKGTSYFLEELRIDMEQTNLGNRYISLKSDIAEADIKGIFCLSDLNKNFKSLLSGLLPAINPLSSGRQLADIVGYHPSDTKSLELDLTIHPLGDWADLFNLPIRPLSDVRIGADADFISNKARLEIDAPYLRQGKAKLIQNTSLTANMMSSSSLDVEFASLLPFKKGDMSVNAIIGVKGDDATLGIMINADRESSFSGNFGLAVKTMKLTTPEILINLLASSFNLTGSRWEVENGSLLIHDKKISADNLIIAHNNQFIRIDGTASSEAADEMIVRLSDMDLSYIFDILNIDYVNFGGRATGAVKASNLFSKKPMAFTESLNVKNFSYGGAVLGDAALKGVYHAGEQRVEIGADIREGIERRALAEGNIWIGRDSLSFNFDADRLNADFLGQFVSSFASDVTATASGDCQLFGTFKNIDLRGRLHADSICMRVGYTGVRYGGSDSVFLEKGRIRIPSFTLYDREGHSGVFSGELRHNYLRDVSFDFRLRDARRLLCYDLSRSPDDFWWGTVYASGNASLRGIPGRIDINVDVTSEPGSSFFFSLSDTEAAAEYSFLTFTDKTPRDSVRTVQNTPGFAELLKKKISAEEDSSTDVHIDLRLNVTPVLNMTMVMDPVSGDKITARGSGPMQIQYETENDDPRMYGKYTIAEGLYNFSLQDVILRDFQIREGSSISFNGDPLAAMLDIRAAYRVNTSLTDLDKSFAYDRDLNRTNVPVDAMLVVTGPLDAPDIDFDLEFPTMTEEVSRKVKSIVSTNDLMSRQIIYLLALNRFYTPEYMDTSGTGGELTSVASSTISSQLGNALSQLTDKLSVMPSFRSDKGDFSDLEMDVGLSSRLLNNRLLINGNFGYRDRTTSTTTFVGDFDVQYLLTRRGNLILKAYNHFNDQNYYLRQALTTQGIGLEYRHDFNRFLSFLRAGGSKSGHTDVRKEEKFYALPDTVPAEK